MATAYRGRPEEGAALRAPTEPFPATLAETWIGDAVYVSNSGQVMRPVFVKTAIGLSVFSAAPLIGLVAVLAAGEPDGIKVMAVLSLIIVPLCALAWHAGQRLVKVNSRINTGRLEEAAKLLNDKPAALWGTAMGLLAQLQGRQQDAADAYHVVTMMLDLPNTPRVPVTLQTYPREAIALTNLGRLQEASDRISRMGTAGEYCETVRLVAAGYLAMVAGQQVCPNAHEAARLADHFRGIRGSWGGLALAAFAFEQLGDRATCEALIAEERSRPEFSRVQTFLPALFDWMNRRQAAVAPTR